jgi:hypothetical protein
VRLATLELIQPSNQAFLEAYRHHSYSKVPSRCSSLVRALSPQVTFPTHHQIWWMCIDDCDAIVRAVACRRLHAAYIHKAAIELRSELPAIVRRLDQVGSLVLHSANADRVVLWLIALAAWCRPLTGNRSLGAYVAPRAAGQLCALGGFRC